MEQVSLISPMFRPDHVFDQPDPTRPQFNPIRRMANVKGTTSKRQRVFHRVLAVVVSMPLATAAFAECSSAGCYEVLIEELYPTAEGGVWI